MIDTQAATPHYSRAAHLAWRRVLEELVVLDLHQRMVYGLAEEAAALFEQLAEPRSLDALLPTGTSTSAQARGVTAALLSELAAAGIVVCDAPLATPGDEPAGAIRWCEQLEQVTHQISPPQQIGNPQCIQ